MGEVVVKLCRPIEKTHKRKKSDIYIQLVDDLLLIDDHELPRTLYRIVLYRMKLHFKPNTSKRRFAEGCFIQLNNK